VLGDLLAQAGHWACRKRKIVWDEYFALVTWSRLRLPLGSLEFMGREIGSRQGIGW
jgi:hypothetical protein